MSKGALITIVVVVVVLVIVGLFLMFLNQGGNFGGGLGQGGKMFEIQGMKVEVLREGSGDEVKAGDLVTTHYVGTLPDGTEFDSSLKRNVPFTFQVGKNKVISGWDLGVMGMKVGEQRKLTVPPELAYGLDGFPPTIPANTSLTYVIEVLGITPGPEDNQ